MEYRKEDLKNIIDFIEENLRASNSAGIEFIDAKNYLGRISTNQNHVIFGRRGAGKSCLISSLTKLKDKSLVKINIEDFKNISYPNIIVHVLKATFEQLYELLTLKNKISYKRFKTKKILKKEISTLSKLIYEPDNLDENIKNLHKEESSKEGFLKKGFLGLSGKRNKGNELEISKSVSKSKLDFLLLDLPKYKKLFHLVSNTLNQSSIYLVFDDFYFLQKKDQPNFLDYFHRLSKDIELYLKVATIKHRTKLYKQENQSYVGVEIGHDVLDVDLDYTLDKFDDLKSFMLLLLDKVAELCKIKIDFQYFFSGDGFSQLCLASGGVPRDFLSLFVKLATKILTNELKSIGKIDVNEVAISNISNKYQSLKTDSASEREILESYLHEIKSIVYFEKRTNAFLVAKPELDTHPQERQALRELVDLRLLHIIDSNTSRAPSDGRRYEAYLIDVGLYDNSRPRNFKQIEPGTKDEKSRKDDLRASPYIELAKLTQNIKKVCKQLELELSSID